MAVYFSPVGNGFQWLGQTGLPLSGGKINTYAAGTTTPVATFTDSTGSVPNANPIILDSTGRYAQEIWLTLGQGYKFVVTDALGVIQFTLDNIPNGQFDATQQTYTPLGSGAVVTTVAAKLQQVISVTDRGADPTGISDSTSAINNATKSNTLTWFPAQPNGAPGNYKVTSLSFTNLTNFEWKGMGVGGVTITTTTPGTMITFGTGCNFGVVDGLLFAPTGVLAASTGMLLNNGSGNIEVRRCFFQLWTQTAMNHLGTVGNQMSGHKVYDSYFLQNANASGFGQIDMTYNNDFFLINNQMGIINTGTYGFPSFGVQATNTSNGSYISNFSWQNQVGANFVSCKYDRILSNRFEQSQKEGAIFNTMSAGLIQGNWFNNNGILTINTYNHMRLISSTNMLVEGNSFWDWSGGVNNCKYALSIETSASRCTVKNNTMDKYGTAATNFGAGVALGGVTTDQSLNFTSGPTIPAATTTFLGQGASNANFSAAQQYASAAHTVVQLVIAVSVAPGAGQSFVYTLYKNNVATALTVTLSGAAAFQGSANATTVIEDIPNSSAYSVQVVTSAGAAASIISLK